MPKFTLIAEHEDSYGNVFCKSTHEFECEHISAVLENVDLFLRGAGYVPEGTLDYYMDEEFYDLEDWANAHYEHDRFPVDHEERCGK